MFADSRRSSMSSGCSFVGKTVIITGASSGIGQGTAVEFAKLGPNLVLSGRNVAQLQETKDLCIKAGVKDKQVVLVIGDVTDSNVQKQLIDAALNNFNQLDVLVNNAGMVIPTPVLNTKIEDFDKTHDVNLRAPVALTLLALPHLIKTKGNIVNLSSIAAWRPLSGNLAYAMSKAGMDMFTKSLAFEVAPQGVRVNAVNPGVIPTNLGKNKTEDRTSNTSGERSEQYKGLVALHPIGRCGEVREVASAIIFLASQQSSFITGQCLGIDGGAGLGGVRF